MSNRQTVVLSFSKRKLIQTLTVLPGMIILLSGLTLGISHSLQVTQAVETDAPEAAVIPTAVPSDSERGYPARGSDLNKALFALELPPPPSDALPYDVRYQLYNGSDVPVKKRWVWLPEGTSITVDVTPDGEARVNVPVGASWWKEFYIETDRGTYLIERRVIERVPVSQRYPNGWVFYTAHAPIRGDETLFVMASGSEDAERFMFQPDDWILTQSLNESIEVRFEDIRGQSYAFIFPGQVQCLACHGGAAGAYPNMDEDPMFVFGFHPNNLTENSYQAMVERGWFSNGDVLLTMDTEPLPSDTPPSFHTVTDDLVGVLRNNCASCHNASVNAGAWFSAFIIDPNYDYGADELITLLSTEAVMMGTDGKPLVTPGDLENSELWLRLQGMDGRRRMPPMEGGLPEQDERIVELIRQWILLAPE